MKLLKMFDAKDKLGSETILRIGLMYCAQNNDFHFIHQTFAEFFPANFIFSHVTCPNEREIADFIFIKFLQVLLDEDCRQEEMLENLSTVCYKFVKVRMNFLTPQFYRKCWRKLCN